MAFSNEEMTDMIKGFAKTTWRLKVVYGRQGNLAVDRVGRPQVRNAAVEEDILNRVAEDPNISSGRLALKFGVPKRTVNCITRLQLLHPYHATPVQELLPPDFDRMLRFCHFIEDARVRDPNFQQNFIY